MRASNDRMLELVQSLPVQLGVGAKLACAARLGPTQRFANVVVAGMGGSGIGGGIAAGLLRSEAAAPIQTCQDYDVPASVTRQTLFIAVSYSGNTEETLSAYRQARRLGARIVAITSGGSLGRLAARDGHATVLVPGGLPPRAALGYLFAPLLVTLERLGVCRSLQRDMEEAVSLMLARSRDWLGQARTIARVLNGRLALVYSTARLLDAAALRWQCQLNENSKVLCHSHCLPEQNHNEIVGLGGPEFLGRRTVVVGLVDPRANPRTAARLGHMLRIARRGYERKLLLEAEGRSALARVFSLIMLGDLVSVELARLRGVDAVEVRRIDELKRRMARE